MELTSHFNARLSRSSVVSAVLTEKENTFLTANRDGTITVVTFQPKFRQSSKRVTHSEITAMAYEIDDINAHSNSFLDQQTCLHRLILGTVSGDLLILSKNLEIIAELHRKHFDRIVKIQFFHNNKYFITASYDCSLKIFDSHTYEYVSSFYEHQSWITDFSISPNEKTFITACADKKLRLFDIKKKRCIAIIGPFPFVPTTVLFHPGGKHYFIGFTNGVVASYKFKGAKKVLSVQLHKASVSAIALHSSGLFMASVSVDSTISILEIEKAAIMFSMLVKQKGLNSVTFSKDGWQLMTTSVSGRLTIWDFPFNALVKKSSPGSSALNSNENLQSTDENFSTENSFPEVSPRPNNSQTMPVNFQMQNIRQQQQMQLNVPNMGQFSYSQNLPNAVYIPGMAIQGEKVNSNPGNNPYEFSDSNSFTSVEAQKVNSNGEIKVNSRSSTSNIDGVVVTDIVIEEEEEEAEASSQGELVSSEEEEKRAKKSFKEEESESFSSHKFKEEEDNKIFTNISAKEEEERFSSAKSFKEEEENRSNRTFDEEEEKNSSKSFKEEEDNKIFTNESAKEEEEKLSSTKSFKEEEENRSDRSYKEEEEKVSIDNYKKEEEKLPVNKFNEEEDQNPPSRNDFKEEEEQKNSINRSNTSEEEDFVASNHKSGENLATNKVFVNNLFNEEEEDIKYSAIHTHYINDDEENVNEVGQVNQMHHSSSSNKEEEEEKKDSRDQTHLIQSLIVLIEEEDSSDNIQYIDSGKYEEHNQNDADGNKEEANKADFSNSNSDEEEEDQAQISRNNSENINLNFNSSANDILNDTLNEIAIEIKPSNTEESISENIHDLQQIIASTMQSTINADNNDNENSYQLNHTELLTNSDSQTTKSSKSQIKHRTEIEDFNAVVTVNSSAINTDSPVYDFNYYSDKENDSHGEECIIIKQSEIIPIETSDENDRNNHSISDFTKLSSSQPVINSKKANPDQAFYSDPMQFSINSNKSGKLISSEFHHSKTKSSENDQDGDKMQDQVTDINFSQFTEVNAESITSQQNNFNNDDDNHDDE